MSVNFHKKLKDEFDRYDRLLRESEGNDSPTQQASKPMQLRQLIANQYLNVKTKEVEGNFSDEVGNALQDQKRK